MATGTVKWFNVQKGYGFIQPEDGSKDVFVHISAVERSGIGNLHEGQKLSFEMMTNADNSTRVKILQVLQEQLVPSGRVEFLSSCEYRGEDPDGHWANLPRPERDVTELSADERAAL